MTLSSGIRIGPYSVIEPIGAGGMGEVYRGRDTKLDRDVALKVLPRSVSDDAERLARLQREARTLAALNHPNIAQIYGFEDNDGVTALVMELVEGESLQERMSRGPISIDEALPIARQIAEALETAHEQGIIHRDLKPANVKVRPDGTVKVLDFGLARAVEPVATGSSTSLLPTITSPALMTGAGMILGTAAYMAPEQAMGKPVDRRADIWAFGVVLAEMLGGKRMFEGDTVPETLASVMKDVPVIPDAPPAIRHLLERCLQRDPRRRLRDIGEARILFEDPSSAQWTPTVHAGAELSRRSRLLWTGAAVAAAIAGVAIGWTIRPAPPPTDVPLRKFILPVENLFYGTSRTPQISPDGTKVVYSTSGRLWVRDLATLEPREIASGDSRFYTWSPDGTQIAFVSNDRIMKVSASGGTPAVVTVVGQTLGSGVGTAWTADGAIVLTTGMPGTGLQRVPADGGDLTTILAPRAGAEQDFHDVSALPGGKGLLYALDRNAGIVDTIMVFDGVAAKTVLHLEGETISAPLYAPTGHILYVRASNNSGIWALPFSLEDLAATGDPFLIVPQGTFPSVSREGTLMYLPPAAVGAQELAWADRGGSAPKTVGRPQQGLSLPSLSPDGRFIAVAASEKSGSDVWVYDTSRDTQTRLTFGEGNESFPAWSPSGDRIFFTGTTPPKQERAIAAQPADGTGQSQVIVNTRQGMSPAISPDGQFIVFAESGTDPVKTGPDLWSAPLDGKSRPRLFVEAPGPQSDPRFSPDGRYLAYQSAESGRNEVYVKPFPSGEGKWQVSFNSGSAPRWNRRGNRLFFLEPGAVTRVLEVDVSTAGAFTIGSPRLVTDSSKFGPMVLVGWDVSPDGMRFLVVRAPNAQRQAANMTIVQNWLAEFRPRQP